MARAGTCRLRLRAVGAAGDRSARGAPPRCAPGSDRRRPRSRSLGRARCRARSTRRRVPAARATARPTDACPLPLGQAGRCAGGLPGGAGRRSSRSSGSSLGPRCDDSNVQSSTRIRSSTLARSILLVATGRPTSGLAARSTSFVGREKELREIRALLGRADVRLLTLTGPAGTGKTRLAVEATTGDGRSRETVFVELAPIVDPGLVASAIASTLGLSETSRQRAAEALVLHLQQAAHAARPRQPRAGARGGTRARRAPGRRARLRSSSSRAVLPSACPRNASTRCRRFSSPMRLVPFSSPVSGRRRRYGCSSNVRARRGQTSRSPMRTPRRSPSSACASMGCHSRSSSRRHGSSCSHHARSSSGSAADSSC